MNLQNVLAEVRTQIYSIQALAALGAELRMRQDGSGDPRVRDSLHDVVEAIDPSLFDALTTDEQRVVLGLIQLVFLNAGDLLDRPTRTPGWNYTEPEFLEAQGRASRGNIAMIQALAAQRPDLAAATRRPGRILDVGTGVAHLAIEAARTWPALHVVGIDVWEPALALARANVAASDVADRIELRMQSVVDLRETNCYSLAWLPAPFISREIFQVALTRVRDALQPGGWLIIGQYGIPDDALGHALACLQIVRSGGYPWQADEVTDLMLERGFDRVEVVPGPAGLDLTLGRLPAGGE
jgi:SAM-dependent methyltransferase